MNEKKKFISIAYSNMLELILVKGLLVKANGITEIRFRFNDGVLTAWKAYDIGDGRKVKDAIKTGRS